MPVEVIYKNRRSEDDRRQAVLPYSGPERRSGIDRRKLDDKLKHMLEKKAKARDSRKTLQAVQSQSGKVVVRRKAKKKIA